MENKDFEEYFRLFSDENADNKDLVSVAGDKETRLKFINELKPFFQKFWNESASEHKLKIDDLQQTLFESDLDRNALAAKANKKDDPKDYCRTYSLTNRQVAKMDEWVSAHYNKYHKKDDAKKYKKNPFYGGVSPVSRFNVEFTSCTIGTQADCYCSECRKKYNKLKTELDELYDKYDDVKDDKERKELSKKIKKTKNKQDDAWEVSRVILRDFDE